MTLIAATTKPCDYCRKDFRPFRSTQKVCDTIRCSKGYAQKQRKEAERRARYALKLRKDAAKTKKEWAESAWKALSALVRYRDITYLRLGCIDCGKPFEPNKFGGSADAGHFIARSAAPHLKFDERNVFAQRKNCNRPGGTTYAAFRAGVVARIGEEAVLALEADREPRRYRIDDFKAMTANWRAQLKALKATE